MQTQVYNQLTLFSDPPIIVEPEEKIILMAGGIYTDKDPDDTDPQAPYSICWGSNAFCFLFDGIDHIENIVELGCSHKMKIVSGYALGLLVNKNIFQIRNSSRKHQPDYILFEGNYTEGFYESLNKYKRIFEK